MGTVRLHMMLASLFATLFFRDIILFYIFFLDSVHKIQHPYSLSEIALLEM
jgi:hypothetical protein